MLLARFVTGAILLQISFSEIIVQRNYICNIELFFNKFLFNDSLKCITIQSNNNHIISDCIWNYFENKLMMPVFNGQRLNNSLCDVHIIIGTEMTNEFPPFNKILLINPIQKNLNVQSMFLKSLNVFAVTMKLIENNLIVLPELYSLVGNKTFQWISSRENFLNKNTFIQVLLRNDFGISKNFD